MEKNGAGRPYEPIADDAAPEGAALARELRALQRRAGLTATVIAGRCGVSSSMISEVRAGRNPPSRRLAEEFVRACHGTDDDLERILRLREAAIAVRRPPRPRSATTPPRDPTGIWR